MLKGGINKYFENLVPPLLDTTIVCHFNGKNDIHVDEIKGYSYQFFSIMYLSWLTKFFTFSMDWWITQLMT